MPNYGDEDGFQDGSHDDEISRLKEEILNLFSQYEQTHDSDEPDHIQQPKLHHHVVEITREVHRLLMLEPNNPGAISLHNDFRDTLHNKFYGHEGWESEWHKPRHDHLVHGQGQQDDDQNGDNGYDEDDNEENDNEYEQGDQRGYNEGHHQAYGDDDGQQCHGDYGNEGWDEHQSWGGHQGHGDDGHHDWDGNQHYQGNDWDGY